MGNQQKKKPQHNQASEHLDDRENLVVTVQLRRLVAASGPSRDVTEPLCAYSSALCVVCISST